MAEIGRFPVRPEDGDSPRKRKTWIVYAARENGQEDEIIRLKRVTLDEACAIRDAIHNVYATGWTHGRQSTKPL